MSTNEQAARAEAEKRWPPKPRWITPTDWLNEGMASGFVLGAQWAESALLARLSDPDDALTAAREGVSDYLLQLGVDGDEVPADGGPTPTEVIVRTVLAAVAARLAGGEQA